jgi:TPP-dependent pyruvate/acetoin dehydrogenase alpha subunit
MHITLKNRQFALEMLRIRLFEERALTEFSKGKLFGTTHTCIGQEADCVGVLGALAPQDVVFSNHRGHGHYLARGGSMRALAAELMGRCTGVCGGLGGSQHLHFGNFYSNGIQGGIVPCATGAALAELQKRSGAIVAVFLGDGTLGEGAVYESANIASLWKLPLWFVLEDNGYAQTTPSRLNLAGDMASRFRAFGIVTTELDSCDVSLIRQTAEADAAAVRSGSGPRALILHTYRFSAHSKGDDFRDSDEIARFRKRDPLLLIRNVLDEHEWEEVQQAAEREVNEAYEAAEGDPWPAPETLPDISRLLQQI